MSEIKIDVIKAGDGKSTPSKGQKVEVHYVGTLLDGKKFDSSRDRNEKFCFHLGMGEVIEGWDIVVAQMSIGQVVKATIPYKYAYGASGYPPVIPAKADLIFEIELYSYK